MAHSMQLRWVHAIYALCLSGCVSACLSHAYVVFKPLDVGLVVRFPRERRRDILSLLTQTMQWT